MAGVRYRPCNGFATLPDYDLRMLEDMSARGWHLAGMSRSMVCYRLERGEPRSYRYAMAYEDPFGDDVAQTYRGAGWEPVVTIKGFRLLRGEPGAVPVFTDAESKRAALKARRRRYIPWTAAFALLMAVTVATHEAISGLAALLLLLEAPLLVCAAFPVLGLSRSIRMARRQASGK